MAGLKRLVCYSEQQVLDLLSCPLDRPWARGGGLLAPSRRCTILTPAAGGGAWAQCRSPPDGELPPLIHPPVPIQLVL